MLYFARKHDFYIYMRSNQILKKQPDNHLILFNKAITLILWEKKDEAIKILRRILKIDANYTKAKDKLQELGASLEE